MFSLFGFTTDHIQIYIYIYIDICIYMYMNIKGLKGQPRQITRDLERYLNAIGCAGRDGRQSVCRLCCSAAAAVLCEP